MRSRPCGWNNVLAKLGFKRKRNRAKPSAAAYGRIPRLESLEHRRVLATVSVNTVADLVDGNVTSFATLISSPGADGKISLREAVAAAAAAGDVINFDAIVDGGTITLDRVGLGEIAFDKSLTIDASSLSNGITIDADDPVVGLSGSGIRIFNITDSTGGVSPPSVELVGLTLTGGDLWDNGGAISSQGLLTIRRSTLINNESYGYGGAIFSQVQGGGVTPRAALLIEDSVIEGNVSYYYGGGIAIQAYYNSDTFVVNRTEVSDNSTSYYGGGLYAELYGTGGYAPQLTVTDGAFELNDSSLGAGMYLQAYYGADVQLDGVNFEGNEASSQGGGLYASLYYESSLEIVDSSFLQNDASSDGGGALIDLNESTLLVDGSTFVENESDGSGGGVHVTVRTDSLAEIADTVFADNDALGTSSSGGGGGLFGSIYENAELAVRDSIVTGNTAENGGGIRVNMPDTSYHPQSNGSVLVIERTRFTENVADNRGGGLFAMSGSGGEISLVDSVISGNDAGLTLANSSSHPTSHLANAGGGVYAYLFTYQNSATLTISGSEISDNTAGQHGGGLAVFAKRQNMQSAISRAGVYNTTISGNQAGHTTLALEPGTGGGVHLAVWNASTAEGEEALDTWFQNTTITNNTADEGGGVYSRLPHNHADRRVNTRLANSIASGNREHDNDPDNLYGSFNITDTVFNLIGGGNVTYNHATHSLQALRTDGPSGNVYTNTPLLSTLAYRGGLTRTHSLLSGSAAIDAGSNALAVIPFTATSLTTDQRGEGFTRTFNIPSVRDPGSIVDIGAFEAGPPKVIDVIVSGSASTHDPFAFSTVDGSGLQLRTVPVGGADTVTITFSDDVSGIASGDLMFFGLVSGTILTPTGFSYTAATSTAPATATWTFGAPFTADQYLISLDDSITAHGLALDGEWTNPFSVSTTNGLVSTFPSGNGTAGGDFKFVMTILPGDNNLDNLVDGVGFLEWQRLLGGPGRSFVQADYNGDGYVDGDDLTLWTQNFGLSFQTLTYADFNGDFTVDLDDYNIYSTYEFWGTTHAQGDADGDGDVDTDDFDILLNQFGLDIVWVS